MCQLSYFNLGNSQLNRELYVIASAVGASVHKHGWGVINPDGDSPKSAIPANLCMNSGALLHSIDGPLMGHIRLASINVPVARKYSHPFDINDIHQLHNGTLTPNNEKNHVVDEEVETISPATRVASKSKVKRSDSLVFLEYLSLKYHESSGDFIKALNDAMKDFHGKFAFIYYLKGTGERYIVRGKTADLYIIYFMSGPEDDSPITGYAVNTSKDVLETSVIMLSNLLQARGEEPLHYSIPSLVKEETIFVPEQFGLKEVGTIKENSFASKYVTCGWGEDDEFDYTHWGRGAGSSGKGARNFADSDIVSYAKEVWTFMEDFSMSLYEMQAIFYKAYECSFLDAQLPHMKHFARKILPNLRSATTRAIRKQIRTLTGGRFPIELYIKNEVEFPWMCSTKEAQQKILTMLKEKNKKVIT